MKQTIKNYIVILTTYLFLTFFFALILAFMQKNNVMSNSTLNVITISLSFLLISILSFILGLKVKSKGLINGIVFALFIFLMGLMFSGDISIIKLISKTVIAIFFTVLGVNKRNS